jgi:hypothetical protein
LLLASSYRFSYTEVTESSAGQVPGAEGEVRRGSSLEGAGKGRLWCKGSRKGVDQGAQRRALIPSFLLVNVLVNLIAVNQIDPYDSNSSNVGSEFPSQSTIPETLLSTIPIMRRISTANNS